MKNLSRCPALILLLAATPLLADQTTLPAPDDGGFTKSMGMTTAYKGYGGFEGQWNRVGPTSTMAGLANFGMFRYIGNPVVGIMAAGGEVYAGTRGSDMDAGVRANFFIPAINT